MATASQANAAARDHKKNNSLPGATPVSLASFALLNINTGAVGLYVESTGSITIGGNITTVSGGITADGNVAADNFTVPSSGAFFIGASGPKIVAGSGAPAGTAAKGSLYIRTDGSSASTRLYINTDGATAWTSVTTAT